MRIRISTLDSHKALDGRVPIPFPGARQLYQNAPYPTGRQKLRDQA